MNADDPPAGKHAGWVVDLTGLGHVTLVQAIARNPETSLYLTDHAGVAVKVFDLECGRADEVSYGAYVNFQAELATFEEIEAIEALRFFVPRYFGAHIDYDRKFAFIAMEYLSGENLRLWARGIAGEGFGSRQLHDLLRVVHDTLVILDLFHRHGFIVIDFKPDNVIRLPDGTVRFVDLGAFFTPRHRNDLASFVYAATPDHAEVVIDASNLQAQVAPTVAGDVFSAGVALFELAAGQSRLTIDPATAEAMLATPALYRFRDSQIADVWKAFPHLRSELPLVQTQLQERRLLFAELWHLLKAYVAVRVPGWEGLSEEEHGQILLSTGTTFVMEQLPEPLAWLAGPIARATALRNQRPTGIGELLPLLGNPAPAAVGEDVAVHNRFLAHLRSLDVATDFAARLNSWDARRDESSQHWGIAGPFAAWHLGDTAPYIFLKCSHRDAEGHRWWMAVDEFEADVVDGVRANLARMREDHQAWLA